MVPAITNNYGEKFKLFWNITDILKHSKKRDFSLGILKIATDPLLNWLPQKTKIKGQKFYLYTRK